MVSSGRHTSPSAFAARYAVVFSRLVVTRKVAYVTRRLEVVLSQRACSLFSIRARGVRGRRRRWRWHDQHAISAAGPFACSESGSDSDSDTRSPADIVTFPNTFARGVEV